MNVCSYSRGPEWFVRGNYLSENGVKALIAGGMGMRPLMGFNQVGIEVYFGGDNRTVGEAVNALVAGNLSPFSQEHTCGGGGGKA